MSAGGFALVLVTCAAFLLYDAGAFADDATTPVPFNGSRPQERTRQEFHNFLDEEERGVTLAGETNKRRKGSESTTTSTSPKKPSGFESGNSEGDASRKKRPVMNSGGGKMKQKKGRGKKKKDLMRMIIAIKMILVSILVPKVIGLALFASWKGITISMIAFTIAAIAIKWSASSQESKKSIQLLIKKQDHGGGDHHHEHWWRKIREAEPVYYEEEPHHHEPYHGWMDD